LAIKITQLKARLNLRREFIQMDLNYLIGVIVSFLSTCQSSVIIDLEATVSRPSAAGERNLVAERPEWIDSGMRRLEQRVGTPR